MIHKRGHRKLARLLPMPHVYCLPMTSSHDPPCRLDIGTGARSLTGMSLPLVSVIDTFLAGGVVPLAWNL